MKSLYDKAQARVKRLEDSLSRQPMYHYPGQKYYYVFGFTKGGKKFFDGPFTDQAEADGVLATLEDGEIFEKETRNLARATREIKAELLSRGEEPDEALRRMLHSKGLEREQKK